MTREEFELKLKTEVSEHFMFVPLKLKRTHTKVFVTYALNYKGVTVQKYSVENGEEFTNINNDELLSLMKNINTDINFNAKIGTFRTINEQVAAAKTNERAKKVKKFTTNFKKVAKGIEKFSKEIDKASNHGKKRKRIK